MQTNPTRHSINGTAVRVIMALTLIASALASLPARAQSDPLYSDAWGLKTVYNPAATGSTDFLRIRAAGRMQWVGIKNAPMSFTGAADIPFKLLNKRFGAGVNVTSESLGLFTNTQVHGQLSGRIKLFGGQLGIGAQVGYFGPKFKGSEVYIPNEDDFHESNDPAIPNKDLGGGTVDFGFGLQYVRPKFHVGLSGMHLTSPKVKMNTSGTTNSSSTSDNHEFETYLNRTLYLEGGCNIPIKNTLIELQPDLLLASDLKTLSGVAAARATYNKMFYAGLAYRWNDAVSVMLGAEIKNFILGYSYDIPTSKILKASSGSHEVIVGYQLKLDFNGKNRNRHRSIRLM